LYFLAEGVDVQGLVNIELRCDDVISDVPTCKPKVYYQLLQECNNIAGRTTFDCTYHTTVGTELAKTRTKSSSARTSIMSSLGVSLEATAGPLSAKMSSKLGMGSESGSSQSSSNSAFWTKETTQTRTISLSPNSIVRFFQLVGECGDIVSRSIQTAVDSRSGNIPNPIPATGFICEKPSQTRKKITSGHSKIRLRKQETMINNRNEEF